MAGKEICVAGKGERFARLGGGRKITAMIRRVLLYPDRRLEMPADPLSSFDDETRALAADMLETMVAEGGIGLAATQIGIDKRIIVTAPFEGQHETPLILVNPEIRDQSGEATNEEGCLSLPGVRANVKRAARVTVVGRDETGAPLTIRAEGLFAACLQHEIDHLDGVLFVRRLSRLRRARALAKYRKLRALEAD